MSARTRSRRRAIATAVAQVMVLWAVIGGVLALLQGLVHAVGKRLCRASGTAARPRGDGRG